MASAPRIETILVIWWFRYVPRRSRGTTQPPVLKTQTGRVRHDPHWGEGATPLFRLLLFLLYFDHFASFIKAAVGADGVRQAHGAAVRAGGQVAGLEGIVGAAHIAAALRVFTFWMWGHSTYSFTK